jgi:hypothetical protein
MVRTFVTVDGEVLGRDEWSLKPTDSCFFCEEQLISAHKHCTHSMDGRHEWVTLCSP